MKQVSNPFRLLQQKIRSLQERLKSDEEETKRLEKKVELPPEEKANRVVIEISIWSTIKVVLIIFIAMLGMAFLERITSILLLIFFSAFLAITLNPGVDYLQKWKIPRGLAVILLLLLVLSAVIGILGGLIPIIAGEVGKMWAGIIEFAQQLQQQDFSALPDGLEAMLLDILPIIDGALNKISPEELQQTITNFVKDNIGNYVNQVSNVVGTGVAVIFTIFGGIFQFVLVLILTFFMVLERDNIREFLFSLFPKKYDSYMLLKAREVHKKISEWVHGQMLIFLIISTIAYIGLSIIGVKYAVTLALIAGLSEFFPYIGPFIAFTSAAPVAFNQSPSIGIATLIFYSGIQMVDGNIIIPLVMRKAVGISPVVTIIAMLIGWEFLGVIGMILAVPTASVISLFVEDYSDRERRAPQKKPK
jgi:predicted PurR-regulated permease PerM